MKMKNILVSLCSLLCLGQGASAQLPDKGHFLWYKGHWSPTKKNVFIIEKDSAVGGSPTGSGTITIDPDGTIHAGSGGQDEWNKKIDAGIKEVDQWVQQLGDPANNIDLTSKHLNDLLLPDAQEQQQIWNDYRIDPQQNLLEPDTRPGGSDKGAGGGNPSETGEGSGSRANGGAGAASGMTLAQQAEDFCKTSKANYDMVMAYYKVHAGDKDAKLNIRPPPEFEYNCYACDSNIRKVYDTTISHYIRDFYHPEDSMVRKGLQILHGLSLLGWNDRGVVSEELGPAFDKGAGCYNFSYTDLSEAVLGIATHVYHRAEKLVLKFHSDFRAAEAIARTYLTIARDYILLSGNSAVEDDYLQELAPMVSKNFDFYFTKLKQNDWKQIGNIPYMLGLLRTAALLGGNVDQYNFENNLKRLKAIMNGFVL